MRARSTSQRLATDLMTMRRPLSGRPAERREGNDMDGVEANGSTVDEAVERALGELGLTREQVKIEVASEAEGDARVVVTPLGEGEGAEDPAEFAAQMLDKLLELMGVDADVSIRDPETPGDGMGMANAVLDVEGEDLGLLIGRRGETLQSLQYLLNLMVSQQRGRQDFFTVDVEGYRRRREDSLNSLARRMADQVKRSGEPATLEPMPANERRIIHMALSESQSVSTSSIGEGDTRRIAISPKAR